MAAAHSLRAAFVKASQLVLLYDRNKQSFIFLSICIFLLYMEVRNDDLTSGGTTSSRICV